jgi:hypothetical protein
MGVSMIDDMELVQGMFHGGEEGRSRPGGRRGEPG